MVPQWLSTLRDDTISSLTLIKNNPLVVLLITLIDVVFLFSYGFFSGFFLNPLIVTAVTLSRGAFQLLQGSFSGSIVGIFFHETTKAFTFQLLLLMGGLGVFTYVWFCLFQGTSWFLSVSCVREKKFFSYLKTFFRVNIVWFLLFFAYFLLTLVIDMRRTIIQSLTNTPQTSIVLLVLAVLLVLMVLIALPSYVFGSVKKSWRFVTRKWSLVIPMYILIILVFYSVQGILLLIESYNTTAMIIIGILLFPAIVWARFLVVQTVECHGLR